jgi:cell division protein FtsB
MMRDGEMAVLGVMLVASVILCFVLAAVVSNLAKDVEVLDGEVQTLAMQNEKLYEENVAMVAQLEMCRVLADASVPPDLLFFLNEIEEHMEDE